MPKYILIPASHTAPNPDLPGSFIALNLSAIVEVDEGQRVITNRGEGFRAFLLSTTAGIVTVPALSVPSVIPLSAYALDDSPSAGGDRLAITIDPLPDDGGSPITALQWRVGVAAHQTLDGLAAGQRIVTVLANAMASDVQVRAVSANGEGPWSPPRSRMPSQLPGAGVESVSQGVVTFNWTGLRTSGAYFCGTPYAVLGAGITLSDPTPVATGAANATRRNGSTVRQNLNGNSSGNSWVPRTPGTGLDGRSASEYLAAVDATSSYPRAMVVNDIVMKGVSRQVVFPNEDSKRNGLLDEVAVLHIAAAAPASATHIAPTPVGWPGRNTFVSRQLNVQTVLDLMPELDMTGMAIPANLEQYLVAAEKYNPGIQISNSDGGTGGYEYWGVFNSTGPNDAGVPMGNYGVNIAARNHALIGMLLMPNNHPLLPANAKARIVKALSVPGSWRFDTAEGHPDRPMYTTAGGHWQHGVPEMLLGLAATGRIGSIPSIATIRPENQFAVPFLWTANLLDRCVPHNSAIGPYPWRIRTVSAVNLVTNTVSVTPISAPTRDTRQFWVTNMQMRKSSDGSLVGTVLTNTAQGGTHPTPFVFTLDQPANNLSVSEGVYFTWPGGIAPVIGDPEMALTMGRNDPDFFSSYNPSAWAEYRAAQAWMSEAFLVRLLGQYGSWSEALEKYCVASMRADWPVRNDIPGAIPGQIEIIGAWWRQIYARHAATVGIAVDPPVLAEPPVRGWYFDGVNDAVFVEKGVAITGSGKMWFAMTAKFDAWFVSGAVIFQTASFGGGLGLTLVVSGTRGLAVNVRPPGGGSPILNFQSGNNLFPLGEWFTYAWSFDLAGPTPMFQGRMWRKSTGLWSVVPAFGNPLLTTNAISSTMISARLMSGSGGIAPRVGNISSLLFKTGESIDLTDPDIRARLVPGFSPIGHQGQGVSGNPCDIFLAGDTFHINKGIGGGLGYLRTTVLEPSTDLPFP